MNKYLRRAALGLVGGLICSPVLVAALHDGALGAVLAVLIGVLYATAFRPTPRAYADSLMTAGTLGVPLWAVVNIIVLPAFAGNAPEWTIAGMRAAFPQLVGWVLYASALGFVNQVLNDTAAWRLGPEQDAPPEAPQIKTRIVILGGGFAGMTTAEELERIFGADRSVSITLVSDTNALLFTPMLAEVAGSSLEPTHISTPLRTSLRRTNVVRGKVTAIDLESRCVELEPDRRRMANGKIVTAGVRTLNYDHLVLALGSVSNYMGLSELQANSFDFKSLVDAIRIRNHVIDAFERASRESDVEARRALLTFVVAGGGFAGVELAGALNDFARGMLADYPDLEPQEVQIVLVHSRDRILPELSAPLAAYALERMAARGVSFKLNARVAGARPGAVLLTPEDEIPTETLVWTAGTTPNPLLKTLPVERDKRGAVVVESALTVPGRPGLWALGDCAVVSDARTGQPCPPTAQYALREAHRLARNIHASVHGRQLQPFHFDSLGALCVVGHHTACAELTVPLTGGRKQLRFSGLLAWLMWRAVYLAKLPGLERKVRVAVDWLIELFFPRDIVQTIEFN